MSDLYQQVREKEGRLYADAEVVRLPNVRSQDAHAAEWRCRATSCARLMRYLAARQTNLTILELGCGNGWLTHQLAQVATRHVWGLDRDTPELAQAARVFQALNLNFLSADIFQAPFPLATFDALVIASAIQYFPDLQDLITAIRPLLKPGGEIHIIDSPLYPTAEISAARARTQAYYAALGFPAMAAQYHHHSVAALSSFSPVWFYKPHSFLGRFQRFFGQNPSPFPWIVIR